MKAKVKFYANTPRGETNKLFQFKVNNAKDAQACLKRFSEKHYHIRAAWFETQRNAIAGRNSTRIL